MTSFDIRPCRREDLPAVVDLLLGEGKPAPGVTVEQIRDYARAVYFDSPWARADMPSLVGADAAGRLQGFVGVIPRRMTFKGEPIAVAVPGNFVVRAGADGKVNPFAALALLKRFFAGPQDLSLTDTANDLSRRLWESAGATVLGLYSLEWFRPIRPARAAIRVLEAARRAPMPLAGPLGAAAGMADLVGAPVLARMARGREVAFALDDFDEDYVLGLLARGGRDADLIGAWDADGFRWMLHMVAAKAAGRSLRRAVVRDGKGERIGAFLYILDARGVAEALLTVAREGAFATLLQALVADAGSRGAAVVTGLLEPRRLDAYKGQRCLMLCNQWSIAHSRRPELLGAFLRASARLSGLDGERWTRFGDLYAL